MSLTISERVNIIERISQELAGRDWSLIDLTLKEFGLPWKSGWNGTKAEYIIEMLSDCSNASLTSLSEHLGRPHTQSLNSEALAQIWEPNRFRLFLSHLATEKTYAGKLRTNLADFGIDCFVAHDSIKATADWVVRIQQALASCHSLLALLHNDFHKSPWVDQEIGWVIGLGKPVFSVQLGQKPYGFFGKNQAFPGLGVEVEKLAGQIFQVLCERDDTWEAVGESMVHTFAESNSFAAARTRSLSVQAMTRGKQEWADILKTAVKKNYQICEATQVPDRIARVVRRWL